ncbi:MAG: protease complex subunit PrcB family protein [Elusimicrobia bacterium]|nr:protease complex subunit PrcB family protein [Elusimicrobiota bacterium]MDE2509616.1 protease complex subunit PrcB family protein [Elusimicrobiota bacterium]
MKTLLSLLVLTLAVSANAQSWERLEGRHSGVKEPMAQAVQDPQKWAEIWRQHDASAPVPEVDFSKESVVVVFAGRTNTSGLHIQVIVQPDPLDANRVNVFYRETMTSKGFTAQVQCEPFAIVKIPRAAVIDVEKDGVVKIPEQKRSPAPKRDERKMKALLESLEAPNFN